MVSKILVLAFVVASASAATWIRHLPPMPQEFAGKKGCFVPEINQVLPFGQSIEPIGQCVSIFCTPSMIDYASCGVVSTDDKNCHVTDTDLSKPYPSCCPDIHCDEDNHIH